MGFAHCAIRMGFAISPHSLGNLSTGFLPVLAILCAWNWQEQVVCFSRFSTTLLCVFSCTTIAGYRSEISISTYHSWHDPGVYRSVGSNAWVEHGGLRIGFQTVHDTKDMLGNPDIPLSLVVRINKSAPSYPIRSGPYLDITASRISTSA
jgi:hypothetical protein